MYPQVFGKYVLERELARGGMARVLLATLRGADGFEKRLVVKQIRDELAFDRDFIERFVEEAKTTVALNHPNIVPVYELGVEQGTYFLAMELVEGVSLSELLNACGTLSPEEGAYVGAEVCRALDYAHRRMRVVHRDITPRNVMVDEEGQVKIIDFGIAARASEAGADAFGTLGHMPPEQMEGRELSPATDLFAVAVLLIEAWSGRPPFRRKTRADVDARMGAAPPRPSNTDPRLLPLDDIVTAAMSMDPKARPQEADDLARVLRRFMSELDIGDIARGLGDRVRALRVAAEATPAPSPTDAAEAADGPGTRRLSNASYGEIATRTFAVREELETWTSQPPPALSDASANSPEADEAPASQGTRRLPPSEPQLVLAAPDEPVGRAPASARLSTPPPAPLPRTPARVTGTVALAAIAALATITAVLAVRRADVTTPPASASTNAPPLAPASPSPSPSPPAAIALTVASAPPALAPVPIPVPIPAPTPAPAPAPVHASPPASAPPATRPLPPRPSARIALLGDPGTRVIVDGVPRGACPVRDLALDPGPHDVRFTFEPTGESRGERITLVAGDRVTLRADFAGASPVVRVER